MTPRNCRPVHLPDPVPVPEPEPEPAAGCDVCAALAQQRAVARAVGDMTTVIDRNVEIRRHPHAKAVRT
ncbi:hypothetical protein [Streptomyces sp. GS7]|uniref:hypothetical protein n=1 Tax=Streptomyces sp. GS7 TaxID=2692234 RepID=UPI001316D054|nr:hypothetical protein [Streptomyces sp. GS7]QHC20906.1 hypothetical protein GR130_05135 [Streptomyces sp. GS7]